MTCPTCHGEKVIEYDRSCGDYTEAVCVECPDCDGTGLEPEDDEDCTEAAPCRKCR
jgi:DnaJ-class molecular chaperone